MKLIYAFPEPLPLARARGIQTAHTVAGLAALGVEVDLYHVPANGHPLRTYGVEPPAKLRALPLSRSLLWPLERPHSNRAFARRLLRATRASLAQSVMMVRHLKLAALLVRDSPGIRLVYEAHEVFADTAPADKQAERAAEEAFVVQRAAAIVCNSAATAARLRERYGSPKTCIVIPNGVDRPQSLPVKDWDTAGRHIAYAGSLFPWKGAGDLIAAAALLKGLRIELIGGSPERIRELGRDISREGAEVVLTGELPHAEVLGRLATACIAVLPNRPGTDSAFTSPIKLFEYMAAGCAIVASDLPALREILDDEDAAWARPGDPQSLAAAIRATAADTSLARRRAQRVREKSLQFTWKARAERLKRLLDQVTRGAA